ncbi:nucleotide exchange factor GrpE [Cyanobium sp. NS01]|uniref:nucleotide exchange factor GrpE n=1 Tax=Cyanobium sp. NS01 TaxID=261284 RepID=UPI001862A3A1|nr:nucleotide exchange factor GrpE [Cyanobium sp. NS01]QNI69183.1 chaperone protein GrpE [Cyanobium sp. NS01]
MSGEPVVPPETNPTQDLQAPMEAAVDSTAAELIDPSAAAGAGEAPPDAGSGDHSAAAAQEASAPADPAGAARLVVELERELASLRSQHESLNGQHMRLAADFDNFRKRQSRDSEDQRLQITCATLGEILPVLDNFDRARQQLNPQHEEAQSLHRSYQGLYRQLVDVFKQLGVSPMRVEGEPFDPMLHEAVLREPSDQHPEDVVIEELQRGYHLNGRVLRHALVKVSMGPGPSNAASPAGEAQAGPEQESSAPPHEG